MRDGRRARFLDDLTLAAFKWKSCILVLVAFVFLFKRYVLTRNNEGQFVLPFVVVIGIEVLNSFIHFYFSH